MTARSVLADELLLSLQKPRSILGVASDELERTVQGLEVLSKAMWEAREQLIRGLFAEPPTITTLVWTDKWVSDRASHACKDVG